MASIRSIELIKRHEGCRLEPYHDTEGILTVGYGHNLERRINQLQADEMLDWDLVDVDADAKRFAWFDSLNDARQAVIENMLFNLGFSRFALFQKMIAAIERGDFAAAAAEMLSGSEPDGRSRWARQVGSRADELAGMMLSGRFPDV